jgi:hypothetical protein
MYTRANRGVKAGGDDRKHFITTNVTEGVIDLLESIQINPESGNAVWLGFRNHVLRELKAALAPQKFGHRIVVILVHEEATFVLSSEIITPCWCVGCSSPFFYVADTNLMVSATTPGVIR